MIVANEASSSRLIPVLEEQHEQLLEDWMREQSETPTLSPDLIGQGELRRESAEFLSRLREVAAGGNLENIGG